MKRTKAGKRLKTIHIDPNQPAEEESKSQTVIIQFRDQEDKEVGFEISVDSSTSKADLNRLLQEVRTPADGEDEGQLFQFYIDDKEVK
jgi:hypothetical protein